MQPLPQPLQQRANKANAIEGSTREHQQTMLNKVAGSLCGNNFGRRSSGRGGRGLREPRHALDQQSGDACLCHALRRYKSSDLGKKKSRPAWRCHSRQVTEADYKLPHQQPTRHLPT